MIWLPRFGNKLRKSGLDFRWLLNSNVLFCKIHIMSDFFLFLLFFPHFLFSVKSLDCVNVLFAIQTKFNSCLSIACTTFYTFYLTEPITRLTFLSSLLSISELVHDKKIPAKFFKICHITYTQKPKVTILFSFCATLFFPLMNDLV